MARINTSAKIWITVISCILVVVFAVAAVCLYQNPVFCAGWMKGRTLQEVTDRFGMFDYSLMTDIPVSYIGYEVGPFLFLEVTPDGDFYDPESVVLSTDLKLKILYSYLYEIEYQAPRFAEAMEGSSFSEISERINVAPDYFVEGSNSVVYSTINRICDHPDVADEVRRKVPGTFLVITFDGDPNTGDPKMISFEYVPESSDSWIPWEE